MCRISGSVSPAEFNLLNKWLALRPARTPDPSIVLIGIDRQDIDDFRRVCDPECTCGSVARDDLGTAIAKIKSAGASVIAWICCSNTVARSAVTRATRGRRTTLRSWRPWTCPARQSS